MSKRKKKKRRKIKKRRKSKRRKIKKRKIRKIKQNKKKSTESSDLIFKVTKKWSNSAYVDRAKYEKKYKLSIKNNEDFWR